MLAIYGLDLLQAHSYVLVISDMAVGSVLFAVLLYKGQ
jgi:hypothetical protein